MEKVNINKRGALETAFHFQLPAGGGGGFWANLTHFCGYFINNLKPFSALSEANFSNSKPKQNFKFSNFERNFLQIDRKFTSFSNLNQKCAFTLAEVLITLGIIGVVAAITLPTVLTNVRNKELETGLKKGYSSIEQALNHYYADEGIRLAAGKPEYSHKVKGILTKYMTNAIDCGWGGDDANKACFPNRNVNSYKPSRNEIQYKTFNGTHDIEVRWFDDGQYITTDGMLILIENIGVEIYISVDVNGFRSPNRLGQDLFMFDLGTDGILRPMGQEGTHFTNMNTYCSPTSTSNLNGAACTHKALTNTKFFRNLPK